MNEQRHHVPGRLRVRSRLFRWDTPVRSSLVRNLRALHGVQNIRLNPKAGSMTVLYDPETLHSRDILEFLEREYPQDRAYQREAGATAVRARPGQANPLVGQIGKIALSALVNKGVNYSLSSVLGARG